MAGVRRISLIITTYQWPRALDRVLASVARQTWADAEAIVADDGSGPETAAVVEAWRARTRFPIRHIWQEDQGFRAARARNLAAQAASGDYIAYTDGDCILPPTFLADHAAMAERGRFVGGRRVMLNPAATEKVLSGEWDPAGMELSELRRRAAELFMKRSYVRRLYRLPLGPLRKLNPLNLGRVETCNFGVWRDDLLKVAGFDESYREFGHEDVDLAIRLTRAGVRGKRGDFAATVMHLEHPRKDFGAGSEAALARVRSHDGYLPAESMFLDQPA